MKRSQAGGGDRALLAQLTAEQCAPPPPPWRNPVRDYEAEIADRRRQHRRRRTVHSVHRQGVDEQAGGAG